MIELSVSAGALRFAAGIADADRIGASARVQAANPINKSRFMFPPQNRVMREERMFQVPLSSIEFHFYGAVTPGQPDDDSRFVLSSASLPIRAQSAPARSAVRRDGSKKPRICTRGFRRS
jgi:hypothetical protein